MSAMFSEPVKEEHYGKEVWVNPETENLRRTECLCFNCSKYAGFCKLSDELFKFCVSGGLAVIVSRCPDFAWNGVEPISCWINDKEIKEEDYRD